jgi:Ca2+-binding RTX toxin-like protein
MVSAVGKNLEQGGKEMAKRIRQAVVAVALALLIATALAGVAWAATLVGTAGPDQLHGSSEVDTIYGLDGSDSLSGRGAGDELYGGRGRDILLGRFGPDYIVGGRGEERLYGGPGLVGGNGNDRIEAADGQHDLIDCGPGEFDRVSVDELDVIGRCEIVTGKPARTTDRF